MRLNDTLFYKTFKNKPSLQFYAHVIIYNTCFSVKFNVRLIIIQNSMYQPKCVHAIVDLKRKQNLESSSLRTVLVLGYKRLLNISCILYILSVLIDEISLKTYKKYFDTIVKTLRCAKNCTRGSQPVVKT